MQTHQYLGVLHGTRSKRLSTFMRNTKMTAQMIIIHSDEKIDFSLRGSKLFKILEKHGISNLSVQEKEFSGLSANNLSREQLAIGDVTRIGPDGTKYFNVEGEI
jgi:hypothetical protein